jgi:hypothetical protein
MGFYSSITEVMSSCTQLKVPSDFLTFVISFLVALELELRASYLLAGALPLEPLHKPFFCLLS